MKRIIAVIIMVIVFTAGVALADNCMRYNNRRICLGDSALDVITLFGEPVYKTDAGQIKGPSGCQNVEIWVYQHRLRRWELTIVNGRVTVIDKIRLHRVR